MLSRLAREIESKQTWTRVETPLFGAWPAPRSTLLSDSNLEQRNVNVMILNPFELHLCVRVCVFVYVCIYVCVCE